MCLLYISASCDVKPTFVRYVLYLDDLSKLLNAASAGCYIRNLLVNHIAYADDICCFCPSAKGVRSILDLCGTYAKQHGIVFNQ